MLSGERETCFLVFEYHGFLPAGFKVTGVASALAKSTPVNIFMTGDATSVWFFGFASSLRADRMTVFTLISEVFAAQWKSSMFFVIELGLFKFHFGAMAIAAFSGSRDNALVRIFVTPRAILEVAI